MRPGQIAGTHEKFSYDLTARKPEGLFEQLYPLFLAERMMLVQPVLKRAELFLYFLDGLRILDGGLDLQPVTDDARILQKPVLLLLPVTGHFVDVELIESLEEIVLFVQDGRPGQSGLVDLQYQPRKKLVVVMDGKSIFLVVIMYMHIVFFHSFDNAAIAGELFHDAIYTKGLFL